MVAGTRKYQSSAQCTVKLVALVSEEMDRQVRTLAARRGVGVATLVREWIVEKRHETEPSVEFGRAHT